MAVAVASPYVSISRKGPVSVPYTYTLSTTEAWQPEMVTATFDGTGASGTFVPCLSVYAQDGTLLGRFPATAVAPTNTAEVTWAPFLTQSLQEIPGAILQGYAGQQTVSAFTWTGPSFTLLSSGFPVNNTFTKISPTSALQIHLNGDFTPAGAPDTLSLALIIDGVIEENIFTQVSQAGNIISIAWSKIRGLGNTSEPPLAGGPHTFDVQVSSASNSGTKTFRCNGAADLQVIEFEP